MDVSIYIYSLLLASYIKIIIYSTFDTLIDRFCKSDIFVINRRGKKTKKKKN